MRCAECTHWDKKAFDERGEAFIPPMRLGLCTRAIPFWDATEWAAEEVEDAHPDERRTIRVLRPEFAGHRFFAQDGSDYHAVVMTGADFFCADFEKKE